MGLPRACLVGCEWLTSNHLGALKVLIRMNVARREGKVEADGEQEKIDTCPHLLLGSACAIVFSRADQGDGQGRAGGVKVWEEED